MGLDILQLAIDLHHSLYELQTWFEIKEINGK